MNEDKFVTERICTTPTLRILAANGKGFGFNRQIEIPDDIDPDGNHLLILKLFGHNADAITEFHHRCQIYMKRVGSDPLVAVVDVADDDWAVLQPAPR